MNRKQRTGHFVQHALIHQRLRKIQMRLRDSMTLTWEGVGIVPAQSSFCATLLQMHCACMCPFTQISGCSESGQCQDEHVVRAIDFPLLPCHELGTPNWWLRDFERFYEGLDGWRVRYGHRSRNKRKPIRAFLVWRPQT